MDIMELIERSKDAATVERVFGEPIRQGDLIVIPVAKVRHGWGGGQGWGSEGAKDGQDESLKNGGGEAAGGGGGGGLGFAATPAGVIVIKDGEVRWQPVVDVNRIVLGGQLLGLVLLLTIRSVLKRGLKRGRKR
jgi:uncharacterized spore protein YtfJ